MDKALHMAAFQKSIRPYKKRIGQIQNGIRNFAYPARLESFWVIIFVTIALHFADRKVPFDLIGLILSFMPGQSTCWHLVACSITGLVFWVDICLTMRYTLKLLLMYKGWMYESRAKGSRASLPTQLWAISIKLLLNWNKPRLYSLQKAMPRLPVPSINDTLRRYLDSIRPLLDDEQYKRMQELANDFKQTIASKLQRYLVWKSWWSSNYVSDWWTDFVYLCCRSPLLINSNYYCLDVMPIDSNIQSARAAAIIHLFLKYRRMLDRQDLTPLMIQNMVPLCSAQYERTFNTVRVPGIEMDQIVHYEDSDHIVVMHKGRYFKVIIYTEGRILHAAEIQVQLEQILNSKSKPLPGEERLASLTAWNRTKWAEVRDSLFNKGINGESLRTVESAAFVLVLDDVEYDSFEQDALDHMGRSMLHGNGYNRWFDKSFNLCVGTNGKIGFNAEHTWADGIIMGYMWEYALKLEVLEPPFDEHGNCKGTVELQPPTPQRLSWDLNDMCLSKIDEACQDAQKLINDLKLRTYRHEAYGKGFMKKYRLSPDAYIQMALQLAYYRDAGRLTLTYEASITRLFLEGRTETVRSLTMESAAWVKSMDDDKSTKEHRISLLRKACNRHQNGYQDAMCGKGIDRHLFALYVVSKYLELDSPFLKEALGEPWRLSTSQSPQDQMSNLILHRISTGSGFGPVAVDGYGVSYIISGENVLNFHITSKASCQTTDSRRYAKHLERALFDMQNLFV